MTKKEIERLNSIAQKYDYKVWGDKYSLNVSNKTDSFYNIGIFYDEDMRKYEPIRFKVCFPGFGSSLDEEKEDYVYNGIVNAKKCVDELNEELKRIYEDREMVINDGR